MKHRKLNLYQPSGYVDVASIIRYAQEKKIMFVLTYGGRGAGKTYTTLLELPRLGLQFFHLRRRQETVDLINRPEFSDYTNKINPREGTDIAPFRVNKKSAGYYHSTTDENGQLKPEGELLGMTVSLSTFATYRSVGLNEWPVIFYDEYIPQLEESKIKHEGTAFMNLVESINRNRELEGRPPVIVFGAANTNNIANPIFMELELVEKAMKMKEKGLEYMEVRRRNGQSILLIDFYKSPISAKKAETALYGVSTDEDFNQMALSNKFSYNDTSEVCPQNLSQYKPVSSLGEMVFYRHKSLKGFWYVSFHRSGNIPHYNLDTLGATRFKRDHTAFFRAYLNQKVSFENYTLKAMLDGTYKL